MSNLKKLDIDTFAGGAARELFDRELLAVMANINDPNTKSDAVRKITLTFTVKPDKQRDQAALAVKAKVTLCPVTEATSNAYLGRKDGRMLAYANDINQSEFDFDEKPSLVGREAN